MLKKALTIFAVSTAIGVSGLSAARADCESDLTLLEKAMATPSLKPEAKAALDAAGVAGAAAMKKDDDATCNKAVMGGLAKAGLTPAAPAAVASTATLGDLSPFKTLASDTLKIVKAGDMAAAKSKIKDLEVAWDKSAKSLKAANLDKWTVIDKAMDTAFKSVRGVNATVTASADALTALIGVIEKST